MPLFSDRPRTPGLPQKAKYTIQPVNELAPPAANRGRSKACRSQEPRGLTAARKAKNAGSLVPQFKVFFRSPNRMPRNNLSRAQAKTANQKSGKQRIARKHPTPPYCTRRTGQQAHSAGRGLKQIATERLRQTPAIHADAWQLGSGTRLRFEELETHCRLSKSR